MNFVLVLFCLFLLPKQEGKLEVIPTKDPAVFNIIYKGDMKWNVEVSLFNEKGKRRMQQEIANTDGFILPISLENEKSGTYLVEVFTPVYDLKKEFKYVSQLDRLAEVLEVGFNADSRTITISTQEPIDTAFDVYIQNEKGDQLVIDDVEPLGGKITRIYNMRGAPAMQLQLMIMSSGTQILRESFE